MKIPHSMRLPSDVAYPAGHQFLIGHDTEDIIMVGLGNTGVNYGKMEVTLRRPRGKRTLLATEALNEIQMPEMRAILDAFLSNVRYE